jgi:DNA-binding transcriptional regulator YiaG
MTTKRTSSAVEYADLIRRLPAPSERRAIREAARLSQAFIARDLDVSPALVSKWERGDAVPSRRLLRSYFDLLTALRGETVEGAQA